MNQRDTQGGAISYERSPRNVLLVVALIDLEYADMLTAALREAEIRFHVIGLDQFRTASAMIGADSEVWLSQEQYHAPTVEKEVRRIIYEAGIGAHDVLLVTLRERSVDMVSRVVKAVGCRGLSRRSAILCRDKLAMYQESKRLGILVPETRLIDALWTADQVPDSGIVVKPRRGSTSIGVHYAGSLDHALQHLTSISDPDRYIAQEHIDGPTYFVCSVRREGKTLTSCVGKHTVPLAKVGKQTGAFLQSWITTFDGQVELSPDHISTRLFVAHEAVAEGFGLSDGLIHAEFFIRSGIPIFCEVAARSPGPRVLAMQQALLGETLIDVWARSLISDLPRLPKARSRYVGMLDVVAEGPVEKIDGHIPHGEPWVLHEQRWDPANVKGGNYTDPLWRVVLSADESTLCETRLEQLAQGFRYVLRV